MHNLSQSFGLTGWVLEEWFKLRVGVIADHMDTLFLFLYFPDIL